MKKIILLLFTATFLLSCGSSKVVRQSQKTIKGQWLLNSISYSESGNYNVMLLNDASKECFEGSTWSFIPNNNTGIYTINNQNCTTGERNFVFTIQQIDEQTGLYDFLLKPTDAKNKSVTNQGFRLKLAQLSEFDMQWQQTVSVDGKPFTISMNFSKQ
ncbi:lipocalin family protein [Lacinutrix sp. Bg11-31]|uniref:lipocalin family protein n=1 Tax=Lacinutrix sp. Bg11-31 TaxID=2057808 RepID=UPI000C310EA2|nr:lipocalin family protein [Lacinutrix sp. Bg11-31]AUC83162.1 lipocalin [Lacinutrix sp. Bg11-31]